MNKSRSLSQTRFNSSVLSSKITYYREKFNQSQQKFYQKISQNISPHKKSSILLSNGKSVTFQTPKKSRPLSGAKQATSKKQILNIIIDSNELNPEKRFTVLDMKGSILLKELDSKAMQITRYGERNSQLLSRKENLDQRISFLKKQIVEQKKMLSEAKYNCGVLKNQIQLTEERWQEKNLLKKSLIQKTQQITSDNNSLASQLNQAREESSYNKKHIELLQSEISELSLTISNTNVMLLNQDSVRLVIKDKLTQELKVMENAAILFQELVSQKENLNTQIDKAFNQNKMRQSSKEISHSRLYLQSNKKP